MHVTLTGLDEAQQLPLTVIIGDINGLKLINDSFGHEVGDIVLREMGRLLAENLRKSDIACRYGGEELLVIMPDSTAADAAAPCLRCTGSDGSPPRCC